MGSLKTRIIALEEKNPVKVMPKPFFIELIDPGELEPVTLGWYFDDDTRQQIRVMREPGESDEALQSRAATAAAASHPNSFGVLIFCIH